MRHGEKERRMSLEFKTKPLISCLNFAPPFFVNFENSFAAWTWDGTVSNTKLETLWMCNNYDVLWITQVTHTHTHIYKVANRITHFMRILLANKKEILEIKDYVYATAFYWCAFKEVILYTFECHFWNSNYFDFLWNNLLFSFFFFSFTLYIKIFLDSDWYKVGFDRVMSFWIAFLET
jgi:hypothetical protein